MKELTMKWFRMPVWQTKKFEAEQVFPGTVVNLERSFDVDFASYLRVDQNTRDGYLAHELRPRLYEFDGRVGPQVQAPKSA